MKKRELLYLVVMLVLLCIIFRKPPPAVTREVKTETTIVIDTIRDTVPVPVYVYRYRVDTVKLAIATEELIKSIADSLNRTGNKPDRLNLSVPLPIERKTYKTQNYFAVVEGYKANLVRLDLYNKTEYIKTTNVTTIRKKNRFGLGVQMGYGFNGKEFKPYAGLGVSINVFSF